MTAGAALSRTLLLGAPAGGLGGGRRLGELSEQALTGRGDHLGEVVHARLAALEVALEDLAALRVRPGLLEQRLADELVSEDAGQPFGVEHGEREVAPGLELEERVR